MPKISVIMPCLNMAKYIKECMDSVIAQTLSDIEILVIDAGSTDGTLDILQTYVNKDVRIKVFHSFKKSYGYQVNMGIKEASGKYIGIVDTDDRIMPNMYETLYSVAIEREADYVKGSYALFYTISDKDTYQYPLLQFPPEQYGKNGIIEVCPNEMPQLLSMDNFLWCGIYCNSFLKKIRLHESLGAAFQDLGGLLQTQVNAGKGIYISHLVYEYRQDNIKASTHNKKGFQFVKDEYAWAEQFLNGQSLAWHTSFYRKQFLHFIDRMYVMAASDFWGEEVISDIRAIAEKLKYAVNHNLLGEKDLEKEEWQDLQLLWDSPYDLFEKYRNSYIYKRDLFQSIYECLNGDQQVIIFGCGKLGKYIHALLLCRGYDNVVAYCDNNEIVWGKLQYGIKILSPEQAYRRFPQAVFLIANKHSVNNIHEQLEHMGVSDRHIIVYSSEIDLRLFWKKID